MKNFYITITLSLLSLGAIAQYGQLPNGGFENWSDVDLYDFPTDWGNSNTSGGPQGDPSVTQSTDAQDGLYSCELHGTTTGAVGFVFHGSLGQSGPSGGIAYTSNIDEVQFQYKCDLAAGDTMFVIAMRYISGVLVGTHILQAATGTETAWTAGSVSLPTAAQDELFLSFVLSNPFGSSIPSPNSWIRIDNVSMHNAGIEMTNVPDPSFENWTTVTTENPDDWYTLNPLLSVMGAENAIKTTDANTGSFAIEMTTIQLTVGGDTTTSYLSFGEIDLSSTTPFASAPYDANPTLFSGAYKYSPAGSDQAFLQMIFYQGGTQIGADVQTINSSATWQTFSSPLTLLSQPDSMLFVAFSGSNPGSVLLLDDLSLSGGDVSLDEFSSMNVSIYPNPASSLVMIKAEGNYSYTLIDLSGNVVLSENDVTGAIELDINHLSSGAYFVNITNDFKSESHKLIIE